MQPVKYTLSFFENCPYDLDKLTGEEFEIWHGLPFEGWTQDLAENYVTDKIQSWCEQNERDGNFDSEAGNDEFKVLLKTVESEPKEFIVTVQVDAEYFKDYYVCAIKPKKSENG